MDLIATPSAPRIFLCDPNLKGVGGHYLPYAEAFGQAAMRLGLDLVIAASRTAIIPTSPYKIRADFEKDYWAEMRCPDGTDPFINIAVQASAFHVTLRRLMAEESIAPTDVMFFPYVNLVEAAGIASLAEQAGETMPRTVLLFRRDVNEQGTDAGVGSRAGRTLLRATLARLRAADPHKRVRFFTDSDNLTEDYVEATHQFFQTAPIPVDESLRPPVEPAPRTPLTLAYLGDARLEKGYQLLPLVATRIEAQLRAGSVRMLLQSNFNTPGGERGLADVRQQLAAFPNISFYDEGLSQTDYLSILREADLVLLPYNSEQYVSRTSGILAEAICAGVPAVVPRQTWLAEQITKAGAGVTFDFFDSPSFPTAVADAIARIDVLRQRAMERCSTYRSFHNPTRLVHFVAGTAAIELAASNRPPNPQASLR